MDPKKKKPLYRRVHHHITRTAHVCDAWCKEARMYDRVLPAAFLVGVLLFLIYFVTVAPPINFPSGSLVNIREGTGIKDAGVLLKEKNIIHSSLLFDALARVVYGSGHGVVAGEYFFAGPQNIITVAWRLFSGDHELAPIRVTVPEGASSKEIAQLLVQKVPDFDAAAFLAQAQPKEGTLFPDTYFFLPGEDANLILLAFENNFKQHITQPQVAQAIASSSKPLNEVLTMASLLEKEAPDTKDREIISGILWKRLSLGMPLQVDAVFPYIMGVGSLQLTRADLATTSPYNTYTNKGLPPGPIANPSVDAILAAVQPTKTNYLYYLSDLHGVMHYCATYVCQQANARKYLGS